MRAPRVRTHVEGVVTTGNDRFPVTGGEVSFTAVPGPAVLALISQGRAVDTIPILVGDVGTQTLRQVVSAAKVVDDATQREIEKLAAQAVDLVDSSVENALKAQDGATRAETAASNAKQFETSASTSASAAASSASKAATSVLNADKSATAAKRDADRAEQASKETIAQVEGDYATRPYVDSQTWDRGMLSSPVELLSLKPGQYGIFSSSVYKGMNLPGNSAGLLTVDYLDGPNGRIHGRFWWEYQDSTYGRICYSASSYNGNFRGWQPDNTWHKMPLTTSDKIVDLPPGRYPVTSKSVADALGLPWAGMGYLEMEWLGMSAYQRVDWWTGANPTHHWRISIYNKGWDAATWEHLHGAETSEAETDDGEENNYQLAGAEAAIEAMLTTNDPTISYEPDRAALVGDLKRREGPVHVGDAGALALVFDHGTTAFRDWVWPELKKRDLVGTMSLAPEIHLDEKGDSRHRATNDEIKAWVNDGLAIASHSGDHAGAKTTTDIYRQIVVSKQTLETKLDTKVDCWVQPGYSTSLGTYKGFGTGQNAIDYTASMAGRLLQQTYPVITGYVGDDYIYPMQELPVGVRRSLIEKKDTVAQVRDYVQQTAEKGLKHISFFHPYALPESSDIYATKKDYIDFLDLVAELRDAGKLKVLTLPQLAIAEK